MEKKVNQRHKNLRNYTHTRKDTFKLYRDYQGRGACKNNPVLTGRDEYGRAIYRDQFTALVMLYFHAAHILLYALRPKVEPLITNNEDPFIVTEQHCKPILDYACFLAQKKIGASYIRMAMPLFLVALHSPLKAQRDQAVWTFQAWMTGGMGGLCCLTLETIRRRRKSQAEEERSMAVDEIGMTGQYQELPVRNITLYNNAVTGQPIYPTESSAHQPDPGTSSASMVCFQYTGIPSMQE
ncbi:hypothetical protein GQ43DRAFT_251366 [Delitschia confertaspora ATCC 74209]|uniref:Uncharacterized protein n=1 Tax=Delitschia confertaspora ATCC 74209 TaxID=1513339 RepID=A0A9P4JUV1_9PLEO|nr:hypothetical protein GQ43DRAFT_251366 [Delitschia confertaspora ATCC 74209]